MRHRHRAPNTIAAPETAPNVTPMQDVMGFSTIKVQLHRKTVSALIDSAVLVSAVNRAWLRQNPAIVHSTPCAYQVAPIGCKPICIDGTTGLTLAISRAEYTHEFAIMDFEAERHLILGKDFLQKHKAFIDLGAGLFTLKAKPRITAIPGIDTCERRYG